jgi:methylated-DNA-[protein]-cysteine S-methyltransferase
MAHYKFSVFDSRFGPIGIVFSVAGKIAMIYLAHENQQTVKRVVADFPGAAEIPLPGKVRRELEGCLKGRGCAGLAGTLELERLKPFQKAVLLQEARVPRGKVISYSLLAAKAGFPGAARAAGSALAKNPFPLAIPCHRAVRSDGSLGGFGGGLEMKRALLEMEGIGFYESGKVKKEFFIIEKK